MIFCLPRGDTTNHQNVYAYFAVYNQYIENICADDKNTVINTQEVH